jgi:hypothetical protein
MSQLNRNGTQKDPRSEPSKSDSPIQLASIFFLPSLLPTTFPLLARLVIDHEEAVLVALQICLVPSHGVRISGFGGLPTTPTPSESFAGVRNTS